MKHKTLLLASCFLFACGGDKELVVQEKVALQVAEFLRKEAPKCRASLLIEAGRIADSLLLYEALSEVNDSLRSLRPFRPVKPPAILPIDSLQVKPIFENNQ